MENGKEIKDKKLENYTYILQNKNEQLRLTSVRKGTCTLEAIQKHNYQGERH